ncbi:MAG: LysR family transcriptional regulator [Gammaproteobacteria bacterium]|nr:LysR family transcriptional regulator [Gammaproteobacteria bacterium]
MSSKVTVGLGASRRIVVDDDRTIQFMGEALRVYATPEIVWDVEMLCRDLLMKHLDAGERSVGTRVELDHLAPTLPGMEVEIRVRIANVDGRSVTFEAVVTDEVEEVARGRHTRFIVDLTRIGERLASKAAKLRG